MFAYLDKRNSQLQFSSQKFKKIVSKFYRPKVKHKFENFIKVIFEGIIIKEEKK